MKIFNFRTTATLLGLFCASMAYAQSTQATATVPKLVRFSGAFRPANGMPAQPVESVTLSVYSDQVGGTALWQETQNVAVDGEGKYSALMGSTQNDGVPMELFASGEPRWLGAQFNRPGEAEQPRVLMTSVPYALKSVDAETLGGKPASAYLLAPSGTGASSNLSSNAVSTTASGTTAPPTSTTVVANTTAVKPRATNGTAGFIGVFTDATDIGNSVIQQSGGFVGIGTVPGAGAGSTPSLDLRTSPFSQIGMAQTTDYLTFFSSDIFGPAIYWNPGKDMRFGKGGTPLYNPFGFTEQMRIQSATGNVGIATMNPGSTLDVNGNINFAGAVRYAGTTVLTLPGGSGTNNVGLGLSSLVSSGVGHFNTAVGNNTLQLNTGGNFNTAMGTTALQDNTTGNDNTAFGYAALQNNQVAGGNTAVGYQALQLNNQDNSSLLGTLNTALGAQTLTSNVTGSGNTAIGQDALTLNVSGANNSALGVNALENNTAGSNNIAMGNGAGEFITGSNNIAIGNQAAISVNGGGSNNIEIGNSGSAGDSGITRIGNTQTSFFAAGIAGANVSGAAVLVSSSGQLGVASSSRRYKEDIEDMGEASRGLMDLRPVTFRYKQPFDDGSKPVQYGLIAEEVAEVYPDLVAHMADGTIETVKYQVLDSMLLNEVQHQQAEIRGLEQQNRSLQERLEKLESALTSLSGASRAASVPPAAPVVP